jgi:hypothetical protein
MKTIVFVFLSVFLTKSCQPKKESVATAQVIETTKMVENSDAMITNNVQTATKAEYEALSRGSFCKIVFQDNQIMVYKDRNNANTGDVIKISQAEILEILDLLKAINLNELPNLKAPSEARTYDGAAHANLTITSNGKVYVGNGFDAGNPPAAIKKIVSKLVSYSEKK